MASLLDLTKRIRQTFSPVNLRTMRQNVGQYFKPRTGTLATKGRKYLQQPVPQRLKPLVKPISRIHRTLEKSPITAPSRALRTYGRGRIAQPIMRGLTPGRPAWQRGLDIAGGAFSATPAGLGFNLAESAAAAWLKTARGSRTGKGFTKELKQRIADPYTGIATHGLGMKGLPALIGDVALADPSSTLRLAQKGGSVLKRLQAGKEILSNSDARKVIAWQDRVTRTGNVDPNDAAKIQALVKKYLKLPKLPKDVKRRVGKRFDLPQQVSELSSLLTKNQRYAMQELPGYMGIMGKPIKIVKDDVITQAKKQIGTTQKPPSRNLKQVFDDFYTQWVDRYNPITKPTKKVKSVLKGVGAELRPEHDPTVAVRRLTGAGGIADYRFKTKLNPILKEVENLKIDKSDLDVYLVNRRMVGFGEIDRKVYGVDSKQAQNVVAVLEAKYGEPIKSIANKLYQYQNKGFQEMIDSGFISKEVGKTIRSQNPDYAPFHRVIDEMDDYLGIPTRKTMQGTQPIKKLKGSKRQIISPLESIISNTFKQRAAIEKNNVAKQIAGLQNVTDLGFTKAAKSSPGTITVWNNGVKEYLNVGTEIAEMAKGANEESMNTVLKILQAPAALLRQGATGRNPDFMIPNIVRDQLDAAITSKYGYIPFVDYVSGLRSMLKNDDVYQQWQMSGAKISLGELSGQKSIKKFIGEKKTRKGLFKVAGDILDWMGKYSEQPTRVGLFKKAYQKTANPLLAMMESRDATVDFARMGSKMKVANSIIPFLNVGVQGFDKLIRSVKNHPGRVLMGMGLYAAAPQIMTTLYNLNNYPEEYAEIPSWDKESNFVLVVGRNEDGTVDYKTFPKGNILPIVANPIQSFLEYLHGSDQQSFKEVILKVFTDTLPVLESGATLKEVGIKTVGSNLPQAVKPITENLLNRSFYKYDPKKEQAREIVPYYLQDKPPYKQAYEFTPQMYQKIGAALNTSPLKVKNLMEGYLAGYTKIPAQITEILTNVSRGEEVNPNDIPILRRFMKQTYEGSGKRAKAEKTETPGFMERVTGKAGAEETIKILPKETKKLKVLYKSARSTADNYQDRVLKIEHDDTLTEEEREKKLANLQEKFDSSIHMLNKIKIQQPEKIFVMELDSYNKTGSATIEDRVEWASEQLKSGVSVEKLYKGQVLTKSVVEALNEQYGLKLTKYNYGSGFRYLGGKGKKRKKITVRSRKVKPYKLSKTKKFKLNLSGMPALKMTKSKTSLKLPKVKAYEPKAKINVRWL